MKRVVSLTVSVIFLLILGINVSVFAAETDENVKNPGHPAIFLPEKEFEFSKALEGAKITYDVIVKNTGASALKISRVRTG